MTKSIIHTLAETLRRGNVILCHKVWNMELMKEERKIRIVTMKNCMWCYHLVQEKCAGKGRCPTHVLVWDVEEKHFCRINMESIIHHREMRDIPLDSILI
jgi:hypothetical protein